ncbi:MAG: DUF2254 domain-containing protein [Allorhizobium sp.]
MSRAWWTILQVTRRLWFRASLYALVAVATAVVGILVGPYIPDRLYEVVGAQAVEAILSIIASSMLAVTTFSLSTLVSATTAAATSGTPRAISLLLRDRTAQSALSTFLGAFLFSLVGLIALKTGLYGGGGRLVLFAATLAVVALIVIMLLRWIDHLAGLGQVSETINRVASISESALATLAKQPHLGGQALDKVPADATPLFPQHTGYVDYLDMRGLSDIAEFLEAEIYVNKRPGDFCSPAEPVLYLKSPKGFGEDENSANKTRTALQGAFTLGSNRNFDQDPLFGMTVLSEIASRALSPGINDPGTAVDVVSQATRLLSSFQRCVEVCRTENAQKDGEPEAEPVYPRVWLRGVPAIDLVEVAYLPISRDGAGMIEVTTALMRSLAGLAASSDTEMAEAARKMADTVMERGLTTLAFEDDRERLRKMRLPGLEPMPRPARIE